MKKIKTIITLGIALLAINNFAQGKEKKNEKCEQFFKIEQGNIEIKEGKKAIDLNFTYSLLEKSGSANSIEMWVTTKNCKGQEQNLLSILKFDSKTNTWTNSLSIENNKECPLELEYFYLSLKNNCGDTFSTDTMLFSELKQKKNTSHSNHRTKKRFNPNLQTKNNNSEPKDSCDFNQFKMENGSITINNQKTALGIYVIINFIEKKDKASKAYVLIDLENCKGERQTIKIEMSYDSKTSSWVGKQGIIQNSDCVWTVISYEFIVFNSCGDEYNSDTNDYKKLNPDGTLPAKNKIIARRRRSN